MLKTTSHPTSKLWQILCEELYSNINDDFFANFREPHNPANRFSTWPPKEPTFRYYLTLVFNEVRKKERHFFDNYRKIGNTLLGQPLCVSANGVQVNLDYLTCLEEFDFLSKSIKLNTLLSVVEVGAGFGRTAHTLLSLCPNIKKYTIIDLGPMLNLSSGYLERVSPENFGKLDFVEAENCDDWRNVSADLAINIDSFQEMPQQTVGNYMSNLFAQVPWVYIKNPVCKYPPGLLGIDPTVNKHDVFSLGLMNQVANIFDETELLDLRKTYAHAYQPSTDHEIIDSCPSDLFAYYQHVLYRHT